jgi:hypothetical protein
MKLRVRALGLSVGATAGLGIFIATILDVVRDKGTTLLSISSFFFGYDITYVGAFIGFIWGCVYGFICGALIAWCYNMFQGILYKPEGTGL